MKLGELGFFILILLMVKAVATLPAQKYEFKSCLKNSLKNPTPPLRDRARQFCLERHARVSLESCTKEASKMEYLTNEQAALRNCYLTRPAQWTLNNCMSVAKKLHSLSDRDGMRLDCVSTYGLPRTSSTCLKTANSFEQTQYKNRFISTCLEF
jgi:hypothetical protein